MSISDQIYSALMAVKKSHATASAIYLGYQEICSLKSESIPGSPFVSRHVSGRKHDECFGVPVHEVAEESHFNVAK
jgi:hypothetical protein